MLLKVFWQSSYIVCKVCAFLGRHILLHSVPSLLISKGPFFQSPLHRFIAFSYFFLGYFLGLLFCSDLLLLCFLDMLSKILLNQHYLAILHSGIQDPHSSVSSLSNSNDCSLSESPGCS